MTADQMIRISRAVSSRYAVPGTDAYEEYVAAACLASVLATLSYDPSKGKSMSSWVYGHARWAVLHAAGAGGSCKRASRAAREGRLPDGDFLVSEREPPGESLERSEFVSAALESLTEKEAQSYTAYFVDGLSCSDIADTCGLGRSGVQERLRRASVKIKRWLESQGFSHVEPSTPGGRYRKETKDDIDRRTHTGDA